MTLLFNSVQMVYWNIQFSTWGVVISPLLIKLYLQYHWRVSLYKCIGYCLQSIAYVLCQINCDSDSRQSQSKQLCCIYGSGGFDILVSLESGGVALMLNSTWEYISLRSKFPNEIYAYPFHSTWMDNALPPWFQWQWWMESTVNYSQLKKKPN